MQGRSQLYAQLATLEQAGMPVQRALQTVATQAEPPLARALQQTLQRLDRAQPLPEAGRATGLFAPWEAALVGAAIEGGQLAAVYQRLATHHEQGEQRRRQLRSRLVLPLVVLLIGLFVLPLPGLVSGAYGLGGYLERSLLPALLLLAGLRLLLALAGNITTAASPPPGYGLLLALPGLGRLLRRLQQSRGLTMLALLLAGGLPADRALDITGRTLGDPRLRRGCTLAALQARRGGSMAQALGDSGLCDEPQGMALISSGEAAGRLDEMIGRYAADLDFRLGLQLDLIGEWLPRLLYFGLAIPMVL